MYKIVINPDYSEIGEEAYLNFMYEVEGWKFFNVDEDVFGNKKYWFISRYD